MIFSIVDGMQKHNFSQGAIICLIAIAMVFAILLIIIILTELINKMLKKIEKNPVKNKELKEEIAPTAKTKEVAIDLNDEDMTVACLIASIEAREEFKKNVHVISVREVK